MSQWPLFLSSYFISKETAAGKVFPVYDKKVSYINACRYTSTRSKRLYWVEMREQLHISTALLQSPSGSILKYKKFHAIAGNRTVLLRTSSHCTA